MKTNLVTSTKHAANDFETISSDELSRVGGGWDGNAGWAGGWSRNTGGHRGWDQDRRTSRYCDPNQRSSWDRNPFQRWNSR